MHLSKYNVIFNEKTNVIVYNTASDGIINMTSALFHKVEENKDNISNLEKIHPELYDTLKKFGFIVGDRDEYIATVKKMRQQLDENSSFLLTVNPTLNCNLRCWYCYEKHLGKTVMRQETLRRLFKFISNKTSDARLKTFRLSFFGGEPLLQFDRVVLPLVEKGEDCCIENNKSFHLSFTTNGTLMTTKKIEHLQQVLSKNSKLTIPSFQITLDGNKEYHDKTRIGKKGMATYDLILSNIKELLGIGWNVNLRLNYTNDNIDTFTDVIDDLDAISDGDRKYLSIDLQPVWQDMPSIETKEKVTLLNRSLNKEKYTVAIHKNYVSGFCYGDKSNACTVNYNGLIYSCTARDFRLEDSEGFLTEDGTIIYNSKHEKRLQSRFDLRVCKNCVIFPICHGGCTQDKMECVDKEVCIRHYTEEDKMNVIKGRLVYLITHRININK